MKKLHIYLIAIGLSIANSFAMEEEILRSSFTRAPYGTTERSSIRIGQARNRIMPAGAKREMKLIAMRDVTNEDIIGAFPSKVQDKVERYLTSTGRSINAMSDQQKSQIIKIALTDVDVPMSAFIIRDLLYTRPFDSIAANENAMEYIANELASQFAAARGHAGVIDQRALDSVSGELYQYPGYQKWVGSMEPEERVFWLPSQGK